MTEESSSIVRVYLTLTLLQTLAASLIWGVNTLFLLDAGLSITAAFVANAAFTAGMMLFEIPTGVVADAAGRRVSFILGAATLLVTTMGYLGLWYVQASLVWWVLMSALIGLGFTFFSGATEAWLVDALEHTNHEGPLDEVFGKGQMVGGGTMLVGTIAGGFLAQMNFAYPYLLRSALFLVVILAAYLWMHDLGYTPEKGVSVMVQANAILKDSITHSIKNPPIRMFMFAAPFGAGVFIWIFYAFQPYLLQLFGDPNAIYLSGIAAAIFAVAQIIGGSSVRLIRRLFSHRTTVILLEIVLSSSALLVVGLAEWLAIPIGFWVAVSMLALVALLFALSTPIQQAFINEVIPSKQRATVLSFSSLMGSAGGVVGQPALGRAADVYSLGAAYLISGAVFFLRLPFIIAVRAMHLSQDHVSVEKERAESA